MWKIRSRLFVMKWRSVPEWDVELDDKLVTHLDKLGGSPMQGGGMNLNLEFQEGSSPVGTGGFAARWIQIQVTKFTGRNR